jgi:CMP-N-acetylneuraminic acid synthetase
MKKINDIAIIVQARVSSKRCKKKMVRKFAGTNLLQIFFDKIKYSKIVKKENFYVSSNDKEINKIANKNGFKVFKRSKKSALSEGQNIKILYEWWNKLDYRYCVLINASLPFLSINTIDDFIKKYQKSNFQGQFAVSEKKNYYWYKKKLINKWPKKLQCMNTKKVDTIYEAAHCLYASPMHIIGKGYFMGDLKKIKNVNLYIIKNPIEALDIDEEWQFNSFASIYRNTKK